MIKKILIVILFSATQLFSQNFQLPEEQKFLELTLPGPEHEILKKFEGKWKQNIILRHTNEEVAGKGNIENNLIYNGRFLEMNANFNFLGYPLEGKIIIGYNRHSASYFLFGIDSYDTKPIYVHGEYDKKNEELTFQGSYHNSKLKKNIDFRIVLKIERENKYTYKVYNKIGKEDRLVNETSCIKIQE